MKRIYFFFVLSLLFPSLQAQLPIVDTEALKKWHHQDFVSTGIYGISTDKAYDFLKEKRHSPSPIIVAVIDTGIDIDHEDLKDNIWSNPKEISDNGIDDDKNGYVDDMHGWNFIGGKEADVKYDAAEVTRIVKKFRLRFNSGDNTKDKEMQNRFPNDYKTYLKAEEEYEKKLAKSKENQTKAQHLEKFKAALLKGCDEVAWQLGDQKLTPEVISSIQETSEESTLIKNTLQQNLVQKEHELYDHTIQETKQEIETNFSELIEELTKDSKYLYNLSFDPRYIVGDDYEDTSERYYGNNHVSSISYNSHGTHVAGIIGAIRDNNIGINGIADHIKIMPIRAVPDSDERDKDVANAIRYAVDNGAKIINMSFGKSFSPEKDIVDDAVRYAQDRGTLIIKAAGNDSKDIDNNKYYPNNKDAQGDVINKLWITVGASSYENDQNLPAVFSNYGKKDVDLFAPGVAIYSTVVDNAYQFGSGTSMAAPMVTGAAALLWSHYPELTAVQVKDLLLHSANVVEKTVHLNTDSEGGPAKFGNEIKFNELSKTGGILNIYRAVQLAEKEYGAG